MLTRQIRLVTGLILFVYVSSHLINHALGIISINTLSDGREIFVNIWRNWPATILLYGSILIHIALGLWKVYTSNKLQLKSKKFIQIISGLLVPFLLVEHVLGTRGLNIFFGVNDDYIYEALVLWIYAPDKGITQAVLLIIAWIHGCIGIHFWISAKPYYNEIKRFLLLIAIIVPLAAVSGLLITAISVEDLVRDTQKLESITAHINWPNMNAVEWVNDWKLIIWKAFGGMVLLTLLGRLYRIYLTPKKIK